MKLKLFALSSGLFALTACVQPAPTQPIEHSTSSVGTVNQSLSDFNTTMSNINTARGHIDRLIK